MDSPLRLLSQRVVISSNEDDEDSGMDDERRVNTTLVDNHRLSPENSGSSVTHTAGSLPVSPQGNNNRTINKRKSSEPKRRCVIPKKMRWDSGDEERPSSGDSGIRTDVSNPDSPLELVKVNPINLVIPSVAQLRNAKTCSALPSGATTISLPLSSSDFLRTHVYSDSKDAPTPVTSSGIPSSSSAASRLSGRCDSDLRTILPSSLNINVSNLSSSSLLLSNLIASSSNAESVRDSSIEVSSSASRSTTNRDVLNQNSDSSQESTSTGTTRTFKNMSRARRVEANARERSRVHTISAAFEALRRAVPSYADNQKLSKLAILKIASAYILSLSCLTKQDESTVPEGAFAACVDHCTSTIQYEGKIKRKPKVSMLGEDG